MARVVGQHDETLMRPPAGHVTPVQGPWGRMWHAGTMRTVVTAILQQTAGQRFGSYLVSVRRPATGYPPPTNQGTGSAGANPHAGKARTGEAEAALTCP